MEQADLLSVECLIRAASFDTLQLKLYSTFRIVTEERTMDQTDEDLVTLEAALAAEQAARLDRRLNLYFFGSFALLALAAVAYVWISTL